MMNVPSGFITHQRRVCRLYKEVLRNIESFYDKRHILRFQQVLMRKKFDDNRCVGDSRMASKLVEEGEKSLFLKRHYCPKKFPNSPGGCAFEREVILSDWVLDYWHPLEKAKFPEYFERREQRKKEYIQFWKKEYSDKK